MKLLEMNPSHRNNLILGCLLAIALIAIAFLFTSDRRNKDKIKEAEETIAGLRIVIEESQKKLAEEKAIRDQLRYEDSINLAHIIELKRRDSIEKISTINDLIAKAKIKSNKELNAEIVKAMGTHAPSPGSPDSVRQRVEKEWCLATYYQNLELDKKVGLKDSIIRRQDHRLINNRQQIASYERDLLTHHIEKQAYRRSIESKDVIIGEKDKQLKKERFKTKLVGATGIIVLVIGFLSSQ